MGRTIFILTHSLYGQCSECSYMSQSVGLLQCLEGKVMTEMWRKGNVHKIIKSVPNTGNSSILIWGFRTQFYCSNIHIFLLLLKGNNEKVMKLLSLWRLSSLITWFTIKYCLLSACFSVASYVKCLEGYEGTFLHLKTQLTCKSIHSLGSIYRWSICRGKQIHKGQDRRRVKQARIKD